ncbi:GNAT family N-acetyltransferase [uncultured Cohaesibacter sp.]|uniref:GNAT family N-acetyltransferase n=1 Tax=uncultured Cohaesibacter sp. TaxID=1002546 RepID=UPI0029C6138D|nr:GNAT family N-acetyltransferase [uncultured Cohaesibacter sp.]
MTSQLLQPILIRTAQAEDLQQLLALESKCFQTDLISRRSFRSFIKTDSSRLLVAVDEHDQLLGYAAILLRLGSSVARIYSLGVDPDAQGRGIGAQLIGGAEAIARENGCTSLSLEVRTDNDRAIKLYEKHGFELEAQLPAYYEDSADGVRYTRLLDSMPSGSVPANRTRLPIILVDRLKDLPTVPDGCRVMTVRDYLALEHGVPGRRIINLSRSYEPLSLGYYCSLLAGARKERCLPEADALLDINWKRIHKNARLSLQTLLTTREGEDCPSFIEIYFGRTPDKRFRTMARQAFDLFRCPILRINIQQSPSLRIKDIEAVAVHRLSEDAMPQFLTALKAFLKGSLPKPAVRKLPSAVVAILVNPDEESPPSDEKALQCFVEAADSVSARAELITAKDYGRLLEFDALFIRETTALNHHTYKFAKRARGEGMPVIDDPHSILCCTNKIYLAELLKSNRILTPQTVIYDKPRMKELAASLEFPGIVKIPDGCFSRGVHKVSGAEEFSDLSRDLFRDTDLLMIQEYMPTDFDWRIGVIDGEPLYACKYYMVSGNWKIYEYENDGSVQSGDSETVPISEVPKAVLEVALNGTRLIGNGFYGVDIKETPSGPCIIEINDNPSIDYGIEDAVLGQDLYQRVMAVLVSRVGRIIA